MRKSAKKLALVFLLSVRIQSLFKLALLQGKGSAKVAGHGEDDGSM